MTQIIVVTGPDGAGKSSVCKLVAEQLTGSVTIDLWGGLKDSPFATSKYSIHEFLRTIDPISRALLISACFSRAFRQVLDQKTPSVIVDGYWYKYATTELALSGDTTLMKIAELVFLPPHYTFFLDVKPPEALARKIQVSDYESGFESHEKAFIQFQSRVYDKWQTLVSLNPDWKCIDTSKTTPAHIANLIVGTVQNAQKTR